VASTQEFESLSNRPLPSASSRFPTDPACCRCQQKRVSRAGVGLALALSFFSYASSFAEEVARSDFPGIGQPRIVHTANEPWKSGYWTSIAFSEDSKLLIGSLIRQRGSRVEFLLQQRDGEVYSFDLAAKEGGVTVLTTVRNQQFEILKAPSGACREPLLLARWHYIRPKEIEVVQLADGNAKNSTLGRFPMPKAADINLHTASEVSVTVTPKAEMFVLGAGLQAGGYPDPIRWAGDVAAWNLKDGKSAITDAREECQVAAVAASPDGKYIVAAANYIEPTNRQSQIRIRESRLIAWKHDFSEKQFELRLPEFHVASLAFSPDCKSAVVGGSNGILKWVDVDQGKAVFSLPIAESDSKSQTVEALAFSPDGKLLAAGVGRWNIGGKTGETLLIDVDKAAVYQVPLSQEKHVITCVAFSPNGNYLAAGGMDGVLKLWQFGPTGDSAAQRQPAADREK
jgi:hypothetical protein